VNDASDTIQALQSVINEHLAPLVPKDRPFALIDFPDHANVGDSAIWVGEIAYFEKVAGRRPDYVASFRTYSEEALRNAVPDGPILIHGGGNFGDIYRETQEFRCTLLDRFPDRDVIQLPQSAFFSNEQATRPTAEAIARHGRFTFLARDVPSLELARKFFSCQSHLCPDMAFCIGAMSAGSPETDVVALMRADVERADFGQADVPGRVQLEDWMKEQNNARRVVQYSGALAGLVSHGRPGARYGQFEAIATARLRRGARQLARGRTVVTDRLHAHIMSLLLGRPHAVLDNSYGKIQRFMDAWKTDVPLTYRAKSWPDALEWAEQAARKP
jgi:pyruvyl transferase EpsO